MDIFFVVSHYVFKPFLFGYSGLEIWCVYNKQLISIPKSSFGKFHSGNAYLVLRVSCFSHFIFLLGTN